jgi:hypothetical protein
MSLYKRHAVAPEWEPIPRIMFGAWANAQERGFHERALKPLMWERIPFSTLPDEGLFGHSRDWFVERDIICFTSFDGEDLLLIRNSWFGFPDPPEWGLASRRGDGIFSRWKMWGHFPELPAAWTVPKDIIKC